MSRKDRRAAGGQGGSAGAGNAAALFAQAVRHHQAGQLMEAEACYRQILAADRNHAASLHHLGIIALQRGQPQDAIEPLTRAVAADGRNPQCHYNIAFAFQSIGRLNEAVTHYQHAVRLKPDYLDAHTNLGNVLMQIGRSGDAAACYERVIALRPSAEAHCNLANVLARGGRLDDAVNEFRKALALKPDLVAAHNNLANALAAQNRPDEALSHFERALALDPKLVEAQVNVGNILLAQGKHDEAAAQFQRALGINANSSEAHANLGNVLLAQGRLDEAMRCYERALALNAQSPEANSNLGIVLLARGEVAEAARRFGLAIDRKPDFIEAHNNLARALLAAGQGDNALAALRRALAIRETPETKALVVQCVRGLTALPDDGDVRALMVRALSEPWGRANDIAPAAARLVKQGKTIAECVAPAVAAWPRGLPAGELFGPAGLAAVAQDRLLQCLLETAVVADVELERFLTAARLAVLHLALEADASPTLAPETLSFACALARQCFLNEQVFARTDEELALAQQLHGQVTAALASGGDIPPLKLAALASYTALHALPGIAAIADQPWPAPLAAVIAQQVREPADERALREGIPALTPVEDEVSRLVRQQYEENPYPRWAKADLPQKPLRLDQYLRNKFPAANFRSLGKSEIDILIAGCGTGQHAIETSQRFSGARMLAIDLSLTSLAYAKRRTRELGIGNIDYAQADILRLGAIGRSFDVIEASGVLHHMSDPFAGWRVLLSLLRPGGLMAVALYSEIARADIVKARAFIAEHGYGSTADHIRRCRQDLIEHQGGETFRNISTSSDFFSISDCRDLLFHVQEHRMTLPQIASFIAANGLDFVAFELDAATASRYRLAHPADPAMTDLSAWDAFEREHPSTFSGMYQFWVQKRA